MHSPCILSTTLRHLIVRTFTFNFSFAGKLQLFLSLSVVKPSLVAARLYFASCKAVPHPRAKLLVALLYSLAGRTTRRRCALPVS